MSDKLLRTFEGVWESVRRKSVGEGAYSLSHWFWKIVTAEKYVRNLRIVRIMRIMRIRSFRSFRR